MITWSGASHHSTTVWKKNILIHADKGSMYETTLLTQLQTICFTDGDDMREHLVNMNQIRERLAEINCSLMDESFMTYIRTSVSLVPSYKTLITTLTATSRISGKKLTSTDLAWHLQEEADSALHEESMNKSNVAMIAAVAKMQGKESKKDETFCMNCEKPGHTKDDCWEKGGGKEGH
jgi:gag-polypeptide of LTR copia-type